MVSHVNDLSCRNKDSHRQVCNITQMGMAGLFRLLWNSFKQVAALFHRAANRDIGIAAGVILNMFDEARMSTKLETNISAGNVLRCFKTD